MNRQVVCITTFRQGDLNDPVERIRAEVFLDTAKKLRELGLRCITLFTETQSNFLESLKFLGVDLVEQQATGMGSTRREVLSAACSLFPGVEFYCWLEPEKPNLAQFISPMVTLMSQEGSKLGLFNRTAMASYPSEQAHSYLFCRTVASKLIGFDLDYAFGPMVMSKSATKYFLEYKGDFGDEWDAILVPRLRIIKEGIGVSLLPIDFENDPRMTAVESGNPSLVLKRLGQLNNIIPSLINEWEKLNSP